MHSFVSFRICRPALISISLVLRNHISGQKKFQVCLDLPRMALGTGAMFDGTPITALFRFCD